MAIPAASVEHYRQQQQIDAATAKTIGRLWNRMGADFDVSWARIRPLTVTVVQAGQLAAARTSVPYIETVLAEQGAGDGNPAGTLDPGVFAATAPDGRPIDTLLDQAPVIAKARVASGLEPAAALTAAGSWLRMITLSTVADTSRAVVAADIAQRRDVDGWVRMLNPPSCDRCVVLSGKWFRWNEGFKRHPQCFPAGVLVSGPEFDAATRRRYEGELTVLHTASGQRLPITGNHPVLTDQGWIPANLITEGSRIVRSTLGEGAAALVVPHEQHRPTLVEDVWRAGSVAGLRRVPTTPEDFHGDGMLGEVDVVLADRLLRDHLPATGGQPVEHGLLPARIDSASMLATDRVGDLPLFGDPDAADSIVSGSRLAGTFFGAHLSSAHQPSRRATASRNTLLEQMSADDISAHAESVAEAVLRLPGSVRLRHCVSVQDEFTTRWDAPPAPFSVESRGAYAHRGEDLRLRLSGQVELDRVVQVERSEFRGHVYNISSSEGWFAANSLIVSNCDCRHVPSAQAVAGDYTTDPYKYFESLTEAEQESTFGRSEARAIREGGDIYRVVNVSQRGLAPAGSRQAIRYGTPTRKTVDEIFRTAGTRSNAIRMMTEEGYITGPQIAGGNVLGAAREGFGQLGKGGRARAASDAVTASRRLGVRDPLNRYTMTAAERRLYDAKVRLDAAERDGVWLRSIGANSADRNTRALPITPTRLEILRSDYATQVKKARETVAHIRRASAVDSTSLERLARALGITL